MTNSRIAFIALAAAFGLAVTLAAITTTEQIASSHASLSHSERLNPS